MKCIPPALSQLLDRPPEERRIGPFLLIRQLGSGGFAPVWLARESYAGEKIRDVAIKLFALSAGSTASRVRWIREARALCRVEHSNIVRFYTLVLDEGTGVGGLAMEYLKGLSLGRRLEAGGPLQPQEVMAVALAVAPALAQLHRAGLLHRDIKPDNIVEAQGSYKLIDFGIAALGATQSPSWDGSEISTQANSSGDTAYTQHGPSGTLGYIDPEGLRGAPPSPASDLYALGATLYACLTGYPPAARSASLGEKCSFDPAVLDGTKPPPRLKASSRGIPEELAQLIRAMIAPNRVDRPPSAARVVEILRAIAGRGHRPLGMPSLSRVVAGPSLRPWHGLLALAGIFVGVFALQLRALEKHIPLDAQAGGQGENKALDPQPREENPSPGGQEKDLGKEASPKARSAAKEGASIQEKSRSAPKARKNAVPPQNSPPIKVSVPRETQPMKQEPLPSSPFEVIKEF